MQTNDQSSEAPGTVNLVEATQDYGAFVQLSGVLKRVAVKLSKTCNDLRRSSNFEGLLRNPLALRRQDFREPRGEPSAPFLDEVEHQLEAFRAFVIGIRDFAHGKLRCMVEKQPEMPAEIRRAHGLELTENGTVHRENPVEAIEIGGRDLAGPQRLQVVTSARSVGNGPVVRRISDVPFADTGRVDLDAMGQPRTPGSAAEDDLRGGRAADVADANEEDPGSISRGDHRGLSIQCGRSCAPIGVLRIFCSTTFRGYRS